ARNRPRMLNELFAEVMLFMGQDSHDSMQLARRFMLDYIRKNEITELALRRIERVSLGDVCRTDGLNAGDEEHWMPVMRLSRHGGDNDKVLVFNCVHGLLPYLRLAYCDFVCVVFETIQSAGAISFEIALALLDDLNACEAHVDSLHVCSDQGTVDLLNRSINAFKSVKEVTMKVKSDELIEPEAFNEAFFASLAHRGVRYFRSELDYNEDRVLEIDAESALAHIFAEPLTDVSRELSGLNYANENEFLRLLVKKAGEQDSRQHIDLRSTVRLLNIDTTGFEKYETGEGKLLVHDLDNGLKLEIEADTD
ncbi:hypothetical protein AAVH_39559, partial [Aphelenchoides avenae]